ncbi:transcriptional regulator [Rhodospirillum rubrum]|uniref:ArsR/SmtB family transcription factor n=1 Tax=Rhodospirillum rubrum TaxID=1085 RepID=UPI001904F55F|nr:metalloregulator ArsR/SmtB family transcription factor [Rhodospirillum rubrum]MBK1665284.1 transcriptional regulator [Rhodospirillum rubrum]MBK1677134.1 transcriptional regulator [Rhodospirillum rubrum]
MTDVVPFLSALAEPTRLRALALLADGREHCVCELMELLGATQSRMSRHMAILKAAGIVTDRRDAQWVRYRRNPTLNADLDAILNAALLARAAKPSNKKEMSHDTAGESASSP